MVGELIGVLVLTRKPKQSIMIGDDIEVTVLSVQGEKVRLGIQAHSDIPVHRTEIYLEIQQGHGRGSRADASPAPKDLLSELDGPPEQS